MKATVKDACVLIDLANGGLLEAWFQLGIETHTTDLVIRQVKSDEHWQAVSGFVKAGLLHVATLSGEQMGRMLNELGGLPVGIEDQTALFLAMDLDAILLTGDRRLRLEGLKRQVEVRGVLWILDQLVAKRVIAPRLAAEKLRVMLDEGARLPEDECRKRIREWSWNEAGLLQRVHQGSDGLPAITRRILDSSDMPSAWEASYLNMRRRNERLPQQVQTGCQRITRI